MLEKTHAIVFSNSTFLNKLFKSNQLGPVKPRSFLLLSVYIFIKMLLLTMKFLCYILACSVSIIFKSLLSSVIYFKDHLSCM